MTPLFDTITTDGPPASPPPDPGPEGPGVPGDERPRAVTRQSIQIDATMRRCHNCGADHRTWQCPEIAERLFAPEPSWKDVALGRELCRMKWRDHSGFVALLLSLPSEHLIIYAASYQAFIRTYSPDSTLTISHIIRSWTRGMQRNVPAEVAR